jgi:hypothetical protein
LNIAFGLFPLTAKLNHSCYPNCHFVGTSNGRMSVRVCDHVKVGQELTVRYIGPVVSNILFENVIGTDSLMFRHLLVERGAPARIAADQIV